jgi:hypothetical protein
MQTHIREGPALAVGRAASAATTSCPSRTVPTTMLVRSSISDASAVVTVNAVPLGPAEQGPAEWARYVKQWY